MAQAVAVYDRYLSDFRALEKSAADQSPEWVRELRSKALDRFREIGLPTARQGNEPWKYTNIARIAGTDFTYAAAREGPRPADLRKLAPWDDAWTSLVFVNGRYSTALSSQNPDHNGARVMSLAEALRADGSLAQQHLARHAALEEDGFTALNTAFLHDGAFVHVPAGRSLPAPLHLVFVSADGAEPAVSYPRTLIVADSHSKLTVIESYVGPSGFGYLSDAVTEIVVGEGAQVDHYRLLLDSKDAFHVGISRVYLGRDSTFASTSFAAGAALGRIDFRVLLDAPGASCSLRGLYVTSGTQHIDNYIYIDHAQPHTTSRLYYKGILDDRSRAVFGGTVLVRPGAIKTDAYQEDKNLLLSAEAEVDSKPSLEIYADDVKCGHGATAGAPSDDIVFYMKSRGLDPETAARFLIKGFASQILDTIRVSPLRRQLERRAMAALPRLRQEAAA